METRLENVIFGKDSDFEDVLRTAQKRSAFTEDLEEDESGPETESTTPAAWHDDDDDDLIAVGDEKRYKRFRTSDEHHVSASVLSKRMQTEYTKNLPTPAWATTTRPSSEQATSSLSTSTGAYVDKKSTRLPLKGCQVKRLTNVNYESPAKGIVHALEFHPTSQVAMVGSFGRNITLFQVDGKANPKLTSVFFERFPVSCAHFLNGGNEFLASSKVMRISIDWLIGWLVDRLYIDESTMYASVMKSRKGWNRIDAFLVWENQLCLTFFGKDNLSLEKKDIGSALMSKFCRIEPLIWLIDWLIDWLIVFFGVRIKKCVVFSLRSRFFLFFLSVACTHVRLRLDVGKNRQNPVEQGHRRAGLQVIQRLPRLQTHGFPRPRR